MASLDLPPAYQNLHTHEIISLIRSLGLALGNPLRAWAILGYVGFDDEVSPDDGEVPYGAYVYIKDDAEVEGADHNQCQPPQRRFQQEVSALYRHIADSDEGKTLEGRDALARIQEALGPLGYRNQGWGVDSDLLWLVGGTGHELALPFYDDSVAWKDLPEPSATYPSMRDAALNELVAEPNPSLRPAKRQHEALLEERRLWTKYYAYQGFMVKGPKKTGELFKAIPVPEENSLWHSLSFLLSPRTKDGHPNMMRHYEIKACIWAYFTQVISHPNHVRWREYIHLNYYSNPSDPSPSATQLNNPYGHSTILRHLHANERHHHAVTPTLWTSPVSIPPTDILHVIADYYGIQIVLFTHPAATAGYIDPANIHTSFHHTAQIYGHPSPTAHQNRPQIFLHTTDVTPGHFSPAVWQTPNTPGRWFTPSPSITTHPPMAPWWDPPTNPPSPLPVPGSQIPHFALPGARDVDARAALWEPTPGTRLTPEVVERFRHGRDIAGRAYCGVPSRGTAAGWTGPVEALRYRVERRRRKQMRYGGLTTVPPVEGGGDALHGVRWGSVLNWRHWQAGRRGGLEYRAAR